jgi:hypothetical protein
MNGIVLTGLEDGAVGLGVTDVGQPQEGGNAKADPRTDRFSGEGGSAAERRTQ